MEGVLRLERMLQEMNLGLVSQACLEECMNVQISTWDILDPITRKVWLTQTRKVIIPNLPARHSPAAPFLQPSRRLDRRQQQLLGLSAR